MRYLLDAAYLVLILITAPLLLRAKTRRGLWSRFLGRVGVPPLTGRYFTAPPTGIRVWFHGVSVGEIHLLRNLVREFRRCHPDITCVISSTTETGFAEAQRCFPDLPVIRFPLDFSWAVERALSDICPDLIVLAEGEWWPNFLLAAKRRDIPVVAVNVRISPRSLARYVRFRSLARHWLNLITHFAAQTEDYAAALRQLGVPPGRIHITGSLKYDGLSGDRNNAKTAELCRLFQLDAQDIVWIAGSTQAPEEEIALDVFDRLRQRHPHLRLILVPRQRDRFEEVADLLQRREIPFIRRSHHPVTPSPRHPVILLDTIGELSAAWGLADIAFVGGSLDGHRGGQNMIEPAAYGAAVLVGPHTWNFRDTVQRLLTADAALVIHDAAEMESAIERLLEPTARQRLGEAARQLVMSQQGATPRTLAMLDHFLPVRVQSTPTPTISKMSLTGCVSAGSRG